MPSSEARRRLPALIDSLVEDPEQTVAVGRQRRREAILLSASHYDEIMRVNDLARDIAWSEFARDRVANPTSEPVSWDEAQGRRAR
jgi:PHD/YefM family antitoxin component YafN of YafNO toxin-antitoxin module